MPSKNASKRPVKKAVAPPKKPRGRPTTVDHALCTRIFERMIVGGESLRSICRDDDYPAIGTFLRWVSADKALREQYDMAMQLRAEKHMEELIDIADNASNDWMEANGQDSEGYRLNGEHIQRSRLRIDARKWVASKLLPRFAEKVDLNHGVQPENPLATMLQRIAGTGLPVIKESKE